MEYLKFQSVNFKILRSKVSKFIILFEVSFIASPFLTIFPLFNLNVKVQKRIPNRIHLIEIVSRRGYVSQTGYVSRSSNSAALLNGGRFIPRNKNTKHSSHHPTSQNNKCFDSSFKNSNVLILNSNS